MRILLVTEFYPPVQGGLEYHVQGLARALVLRGHSVSVATLSPTQRTNDGVDVYTVGSLTKRMPSLYRSRSRPFHPPGPDPLVRKALDELIDKLSPDVIHAHNWMAASVPLRKSIPLVLSLHDYFLVCARRDYFHMNLVSCPSPGLLRCTRCASEHFGVIKGSLIAASLPLARSLLRPSAVIAVNRQLAAQGEQYFNCAVHHIPNFIPTDLPRDTSFSPDLPSEPYVLYAGSYNTAKGVDLLVDAWDGGRGFPARLVLALINPNDYPPVDGPLVLSLERSQVLSAMEKSAMLVVPSLWKEPCPTTVLEAFAMRTPVIATHVGGLPEIIHDEVNGLLVPPRNLIKLRSAICRLLADPLQCSKLVDSAIATLPSYRDIEVVPQLEAIYQSVLPTH